MMGSSFSSGTFLRLLGLLGLLLAAHPGLAQSTSDGSIYSRFGLGELRSFSSSQIQALGGGGTALPAFNYVNHNNPASFGNLLLTRAAGGVLFQGLEATDASQNTSLLTEGSLNAIQFSFPLLSRRLGAGLAFEPYSRVGYQVQTEGQLDLTDPALADTAHYRITYAGSGGLQQFTGGVGYRVNNHVSVGASLNVLFGILEDIRRTTFNEPSYTPSVLRDATRLHGFTATAGGLFTLPGFLREGDLLSLGATVTLPASLTANRVRTLGESADRDTLGTSVPGSMNLPLSASLGAAYNPNNRWLLVLDGRYEPWSSFSSDLTLPGYAPDGASFFRDRLRGSAGVEFYPAGNDQSAPFLERVAYRLGVSYDRAYVAPQEDLDLNTLALTAGFSLPTLLPGTRLDLNLEIGTRGTTDRDLVRDRFYRIGANVNFGERWFEKRKLR